MTVSFALPTTLGCRCENAADKFGGGRKNLNVVNVAQAPTTDEYDFESSTQGHSRSGDAERRFSLTR